MYLKIHQSPQGTVIAVCDRELLGTTLQGDSFDVEISAFFYGGEEIGEDELKLCFSQTGSLNLVGKRTIECAIACGAVDRAAVCDIAGIPHAVVL
jgi:hypothetical protein